MPDGPRVDRLEVTEVSVGGLSRRQLMNSLSSRGILVNGHAETLIENVIFDDQTPRPVVVTERTVPELGLPSGATLTQIFEAAQQQGLLLCPVNTAPYLRMALNEQVASRDSVMSSGSAPDGSLTVAAEANSKDDDYPKGFYLRVVDGQAWLRGYRCDDEHTWSPDDRFIFQLPTLPTRGPAVPGGQRQTVANPLAIQTQGRNHTRRGGNRAPAALSCQPCSLEEALMAPLWTSK